MEITKNQHGFTLLEILISITIAGAVGVLIAQVFFTTSRTNNKTELLKDVKQNGEYAIGIMERMIRSSLRIESTCETTGTTLTTLQMTNPNGDMTTLGCVLDGSTRIASTSASTSTAEYLTSDNVSLGGTACTGSTLSFICTSYPDEPPRVTVSFSLSQLGTSAEQSDQASIQFQTTATPRNK
jgi:prepilin-type N-terminal cleavage/methylation domain-containing protein